MNVYKTLLLVVFVQLSGQALSNPFSKRGDCEDKAEYCDLWADDGDCENDEDFMEEYCKNTCGWCEEGVVNPTGGDCEDDDEYCDEWADDGDCENDKDYMEVYCKKTCGWCGEKPTEGVVNPIGGDCEDKGEYCDLWAEVGECEDDEDFMEEFCKKTCGWCGEIPTEEAIVKPTEGKPTEEPVVKPSEEPGSFKCGVRWNEEDKRIVGGSVAASNQEWPWQAGLKEPWDEAEIFCGGSLINNEWILTAAHCIEDLVKPGKGCTTKNARKVKVVLGEFDQKNVDGHEVDKDVSHLCMHSKYDKKTLDYDIALLHLETPVKKFNATMSPVCLPTSSTDFPPGTECTTTGFGRTSEGGKISNRLREVKLPLRSLQYCKKKYGEKEPITDRMLCAGDRGGKDSCQGDSGGPLVCKDEQSDRFILWGVVSWGKGCAVEGNPGLYADVKYFLPWIEATMKSVP